MASVDDIVAAIIELLGPCEPMRVQKLLYLAYGWSLRLRGEPLFDNVIEGWKYGPMIEDVYQDYREYKDGLIVEADHGRSYALQSDEAKLVEAVLRLYRAETLGALTEMTMDDAWREAWDRRTKPDRGRQALLPHLIRRVFDETPPLPPGTTPADVAFG